MRWRGRPDGERRCNPGIMTWAFILNATDKSSQEDFKQSSNVHRCAVSKSLWLQCESGLQWGVETNTQRDGGRERRLGLVSESWRWREVDFGYVFIKTGKHTEGPLHARHTSSILHKLTHLVVTKSLKGGY